MYQNIWSDRKNKKIHVWDDKKGYFTENIYKYDYGYVQSPAGSKKSIFGEDVIEINKYEAKHTNKNVYETDVKTDVRYLIDNYYDSDEMSKNHVTLNFDIEVDSSEGFPVPKKNKITAIAGNIVEIDKYFVLILDENHELENNVNHENANIKVFKNEEDLLVEFFRIYNKLNPTILTGWNIDLFDIPYIYERTLQILNEDFANKISPISIVERDFFDERKYRIAGVSILDYMDLYKKFKLEEQPSYRLDYICRKEINEGKIEYEGNLNDLYINNINKFIEYVLNDTVLVNKLDKKMDYINLARSVSHVGHIKYEDIYQSSKYIEGAFLCYTKSKGLVVPNKKPIKLEINSDIPKGTSYIEFKEKLPPHLPPQGTLSFKKSSSKKIYVSYKDKKENYLILREPTNEFISKEYPCNLEFVGAYVKEPYKGLHRWIFDLDLKSMYPFILISLNISPETKIGRVYDYDYKKFIEDKGVFNIEYDGKYYKDIEAKSIRKLLKEKNLSLSSNGIFYRLDKMGIIPTLLIQWSQKRDEFKEIRDDYGYSGDDENYNFYDRKQMVQKIILNSLYGVLGLSAFRFYDIDNAEATTSTGRTLTKFSEEKGNEYYNKVLNNSYTTIDYTLYGDTDSIYMSAIPIIENNYTKYLTKNEDDIIQKTLEISKEVEKYINKEYNKYAKIYHGLDSHNFSIKQELIGKTGFWVAKKRYAQWIKNKEGVPKDFIDYKGLDVVRSDFPTSFINFVDNVIKNIMANQPKKVIDEIIVNFMNKLKEFPIEEISSSSSVNNIKEYTVKDKKLFKRPIKGAPSHVKGAINYNNLVDLYGLNKHYDYIKSKDKVKIIYLTKNRFDFDVIAFSNDNLPKEIKDFIVKHRDYNKMFKSLLVKKLKSYYDAMGWGDLPNKNDKILSEFFE